MYCFYRQDRMLEILFKTAPWVAASTSFFVTALMAETVTMHPSLMAVVSTGRWSVPQVSTSVAEGFDVRRVNTNLKLDADGHFDVEGKLTFTVVLAGRTGRAEEARSAFVKVVVSWAYVRAASVPAEFGEDVRVVNETC